MAQSRATVGRMLWWESLKENVTKFVFACVTCRRNKARCHKPYKLLQPLPVPEKPWHTVTFITCISLSPFALRLSLRQF
jgi:hypothetical protein